MTQRWKIILQYDGRPFCGWQRQKDGVSVQSALEEAIVKFSGETVKTHAAGRTDSGVHALGQCVHFDLDKPTEADTVQSALNAHLKHYPISVLKCEAVEADFHARFSARKRAYIYKILCRRAPPVFEQGRVWHIKHALDVEAMQAGANYLIGHHDFSSFRAILCQAKSPVKTIDDIRFSVDDRGIEGLWIDMYIEARSFLHHQVRNIIGNLKMVGEGKWPPEKIKDVLEARDRTLAGPTGSPDGLYFLKVGYSDPEETT